MPRAQGRMLLMLRVGLWWYPRRPSRGLVCSWVSPSTTTEQQSPCNGGPLASTKQSPGTVSFLITSQFIFVRKSYPG
jgi:hypothetical protein